MKNKTRDMIECSLFTALLCIFCPLAVPVGTVPVTLAVFAVLLAAVVLGSKKAAVAVGVYILLGLVGLPVFSYGKSGFPVIFGPTGGYLWSYFLMALIAGFFSVGSRAKHKFAFSLIGCFLAVDVCYLCGTVQFVLLTHTGVYEALAVCVLPFIVVDIIKCFCAVLLGLKIRKKLPYRS
ncbi:MAG: biotin transporter BioY [Clostridia bacterium]|nr:biotin transporter BioY [Clostridia bacterium]